jgi:hypothetical protein
VLLRCGQHPDTQRAVDLAAAVSQAFNDEGSMSTFSVGEIAILLTDAWAPKFTIGSEVTILRIADAPGSPVEYCIDVFEYRDEGLTIIISCCVAGVELRKIPPKQDWKSLCNLADAPTDKPLEPA